MTSGKKRVVPHNIVGGGEIHRELYLIPVIGSIIVKDWICRPHLRPWKRHRNKTELDQQYRTYQERITEA